MSKILVTASVSLDGFMEGPGRDISWHHVDEELHQHLNDLLRPARAFLDGRVTHELMADFWPTADQDPDAPAQIKEFAAIWREKPKYVFSTTLEHAEWNTTIVRSLVVEDILAMKAEPGGDLALGGADLLASFRAHDLVDEYRLYVNPIVLGAGKPLFEAPTTRHDLTLLGTRTFGNGVVELHYARDRG